MNVASEVESMRRSTRVLCHFARCAGAASTLFGFVSILFGLKSMVSGEVTLLWSLALTMGIVLTTGGIALEEKMAKRLRQDLLNEVFRLRSMSHSSDRGRRTE
jgi:hypothetical protein